MKQPKLRWDKVPVLPDSFGFGYRAKVGTWCSLYADTHGWLIHMHGQFTMSDHSTLKANQDGAVKRMGEFHGQLCSVIIGYPPSALDAMYHLLGASLGYPEQVPHEEGSKPAPSGTPTAHLDTNE